MQIYAFRDRLRISRETSQGMEAFFSLYPTLLYITLFSSFFIFPTILFTFLKSEIVALLFFFANINAE